MAEVVWRARAPSWMGVLGKAPFLKMKVGASDEVRPWGGRLRDVRSPRAGRGVTVIRESDVVLRRNRR